LIAIGIGICLLVACEAAARYRLRFSFVPGERWDTDWSVLARFDPTLGWASDSDTRAKIEVKEFAYNVAINSQGLRGQPPPKLKHGGVKRVVFLGDGVTWGQGVQDGDRFSDVLAFEFGPRLEVVNAAVPGYGTDQEWWMLSQRGDELDPDLVIVTFVLDDILDCEGSERNGMAKPRFVFQRGTWNIEGLPVPDRRSLLARCFGPCLSEIGAHSALFYGWQRWSKGKPHCVELEPRGRPVRPQFEARVKQVAESLFADDSPARHALSLIRGWCERRGARFAVLVLPFHHDQYLYEPMNDRPEFDGTTVLTKALVRVGAELGFEVLNIDAAMFARVEKGQRLHCGDGHLNVAGHELVSDALQPKIEGWLFSAR
jgi:lysophospholipase L1-like esterase